MGVGPPTYIDTNVSYTNTVPAGRAHDYDSWYVDLLYLVLVQYQDGIILYQVGPYIGPRAHHLLAVGPM